MLKERTGNTVNLSPRVNGKHPEQGQHFEAIGEVYQTIHTSGLYQYTLAWIEARWYAVLKILHQLEQLPEPEFIEMMEVIEGLREAGNDLRLARFLFDVEEINQVYRLIMRNRAVLRSAAMLQKTLQTWPTRSPP